MSQVLHCVNHPTVETYLRCNRCEQPICIKCAVRTPVGYRCKNCVNAQQQVFYTEFRPVYYLVAALVALPLSLVAGWLIPSLGWYAIILGPLAGGGVASLVRWAIRRRRGRYVWVVVCGCIVVGALPELALTLFALLGGGWMGLLWVVVYVVTAASTAYAVLRPGRRV